MPGPPASQLSGCPQLGWRPGEVNRSLVPGQGRGLAQGHCLLPGAPVPSVVTAEGLGPAPM